MVLFEIDPQRPPVTPFERDAPRAVDVDRITLWPRAAQRMEIKPRLIERFQTARFVKCIQTYQKAAAQIGSHAGALASLEQFSQTAVPETLDHPIGL